MIKPLYGLRQTDFLKKECIIKPAVLLQVFDLNKKAIIFIYDGFFYWFCVVNLLQILML